MIWLLGISSLLFAAACFVLLALLRRSGETERAERARLNEAATKLSAIASDAQQRLKILASSAHAGILVVDSRGSILESNTDAERLLDAAPGALGGQTVMSATMAKEFQDFVAEQMRLGTAGSRDIPLPGGQARVLRVSISPLRAGISEAPTSMLVLLDISELKRLETIRRDFVANVSHELRTPLASIRAMAETLQDGALHDEEVAVKFLETIVREADRLARISSDLLVLSNAESNPPERQRFDLSELLRDVVGRCRLQAAESDIELGIETGEGLVLNGSRDQIEQVVVNLVDNAVKYTGRGGKVLVRANAEGALVRLEVQDTGIGIMQQDLPRLFERFYRVDKARSRESGGTGLGLSIVKNIVEAHGGHVEVASEYNHGSTFTVLLPRDGA